jgi:hypothetical protein
MRKFLISAALISATAFTAMPAAAQYNRGYGYGYNQGQNIQQQLDRLVERIRRAEDRDIISEREEDRLLRQADRIDRLFHRYRRNGLTQWEHRDLQQRIQHLRQELRFERREERWDDRRDRRDDRWDDRRDDRWDD